MSPEEELKNAETFIEKLGLKCKVLTLEDFRIAHAEANRPANESVEFEREKDTKKGWKKELLADLEAQAKTKRDREFGAKQALRLRDLRDQQRATSTDTATDATAAPRGNDISISETQGNSLGGVNFAYRNSLVKGLLDETERRHNYKRRAADNSFGPFLEALESHRQIQKLQNELAAAVKVGAADETAWKLNVDTSLEQMEARMMDVLRFIEGTSSENAQCPLKSDLNVCAIGDVAQEDLEIISKAIAQPSNQRHTLLRDAYSRPDGIDQIAAITKELRFKQPSGSSKAGEINNQIDQLKMHIAAEHSFPLAYASDEARRPCAPYWSKLTSDAETLAFSQCLNAELGLHPSAKNLYDTGETPHAYSPLELQPASSKQVGGNHYKNLVIQPVEYCQRNGLGFCESSVVKYVSRYKAKNGVEDLRKARHFLDLLIEMCEKDAGTTYCIKPDN